ncbi:Fbox domain containing protein [Acanthamoeba castellanii str. Neff]|uniref:Fbox domain containing protein n=1 Tax=Acanthamoeba castellanii (strain ATCC 30010 / Neff) TaxID=1257118 RepID=L8GF78_ACACF|nr:Fbox domain containing protein [Acanthamoeba castellanii str. Neff]ELR11524.1 Fbox domain containing protein [Acanthamoeba castellanii str. Neff]
MEGAEVEAYGDEEVAGLFWLPAELWAMVCGYLDTGDLARLSTTCWTLRSLALSRKSMRQALTFASSWPALVSLDLSAWDSFSDSLVKHLPETLESLTLSYTAITNRGTSYLSRLTALRELNLASTTRLGVEHLQWIPSSVEVLDLSSVSGPERQLRMPTTLTSLDLSNSYLYAFNVDFDVCLPRLETLRANRSEVIRGSAEHPPLMWSLPSGLKSLSFAHATISKEWDLLAFLPASITSLDFSFTRLSYEQALSVRTPASLWFETLPKRLPHLRLINLATSYASNEPQCLKVASGHKKSPEKLRQSSIVMQEHSVQVVCPAAYFYWQGTVPWVLPQGRFDTEARSREDQPVWQALIRRCAEQRELLSWQPLDPPHSSDEALEKEEEDDDDEGGGDDAQGSLLSVGL